MDSAAASAAPAVDQSVGVGAPKHDKKNKNKKPFPKKAEGGAESSDAKTVDAKKKAAADAKKKENSNPNEPYIVIIKNAENDLCRIHESALPHFLGLNVGNQEKRRDGASYYEVKIRSETRTGELTFHGKDETAFFRTANATKSGKVDINKQAGKKREREADDAAESETPAVDPANEGEATLASSEGEARYTTIADMLATMSSRPYYNNHLTYKHTADAAASTSLMGKLCGAVAEVNQKLNPKALRKVMKDVPGFLSCWFLKATGPSTSQFRVVFNTEDELLSAKEMLDQFEADQGIRVSIKLSDNLASKFQKFLVEKAGGGAESGDVVTLNKHNDDYE